jgi:histidinol dehydrogenase
MINNIYNNPIDYTALTSRPLPNKTAVKNIVQDILKNVKENGDTALWHYAKSIDQLDAESLLVSTSEINAASSQVSNNLKNAIQQAKANITTFHEAQIKKENIIETMPGVQCWRKTVAIQKVGLYIPGGTAPLFSTVLMLAIPAQIAGCQEIVLCTPAKNNSSIAPEILYTAQLCGISKIYKLGGAAAIAAMAYGTQSVPQVNKIFGPGNQYVTTAKQLIQESGVAIDMPAGPSEICIIADGTAVPSFVAADLLSQAEHGSDSQVILITLPGFNLNELQLELQAQTEALPRKEMVISTLNNSKIIMFDRLKKAIDFANEYAPEHLIISCANTDEICNQIINAGSIFLGNYSPESVGDYASGTNHTLPTNGFAKQYSGVSVESFVKNITVQKLTAAGLQSIAPTVIAMANAEQLQAHANAVAIRLNNI